MEIINDSQWEPDEEFYLRMSLLNEPEARDGVQLGRISIMEIVILNDDGECPDSDICVLIVTYVATIAIFIQSTGYFSSLYSLRNRALPTLPYS